jgi:hypothetical protein
MATPNSLAHRGIRPMEPKLQLLAEKMVAGVDEIRGRAAPKNAAAARRELDDWMLRFKREENLSSTTMSKLCEAVGLCLTDLTIHGTGLRPYLRQSKKHRLSLRLAKQFRECRKFLTQLSSFAGVVRAGE